jgi:hypothetical protein
VGRQGCDGHLGTDGQGGHGRPGHSGRAKGQFYLASVAKNRDRPLFLATRGGLATHSKWPHPPDGWGGGRVGEIGFLFSSKNKFRSWRTSGRGGKAIPWRLDLFSIEWNSQTDLALFVLP